MNYPDNMLSLMAEAAAERRRHAAANVRWMRGQLADIARSHADLLPLWQQMLRDEQLRARGIEP